MNETTFRHPQFGEVRTITRDGEPWFVGKDVASILGYKDTVNAIKSHVDDEDSMGWQITTPSRGVQQMTVINESGLYSLVLSSKLPTAKQFKRWVTADVLPSIRKHGVYAVDDVLQNPDMLISALSALKAEREKTATLEARAEADRPKVLFAEAVSASQTSILVGDLAKLLNQNGINIGQRRLFAWLREHGYLMKEGTSSVNMPTQRSRDMDLFEIKVSTHINGDGVVVETKTPKVTGKGQVYFVEKFLKERKSNAS